MYKNNYVNLDIFFKNTFFSKLKKEFKHGSLYNESDLQCILYAELRKVYDFVYPETNYGKNRADLIIMNKPIRSINKVEDTKQIFESIIELKYGNTIGKLEKTLALDMVALINDGNYGNRFLLYILDRSHIENKNTITNEIKELEKKELIKKAIESNYFKGNKFKKNHLEGINIIGYIWNGEKLELINNEA